MSPAEAAFVARLERRAAKVSPEIARRYLEAYKLIRSALSETELVRAINQGTVERLIAQLVRDDFDPAVAKLRARLDMLVLDAARAEAGALPSFIKAGAFDVLNPAVIDAARSFRLRLVNELREEVSDTIRQAVKLGLEQGRNPRTVARTVRGLVGLSPQQATAVMRFRMELESGDRAALGRALARDTLTRPDGSTIVRSGHAGGYGLGKRDLALLDRMLGDEPLKPAQIERMTEAYRKRLEAWNTESQARTIALEAQKIGQYQSWEDAIARGVVKESDLAREWLAVGGPQGDGRNRPAHLALHGTRVGFRERFPNGQLIPGESDFNCRCQGRVILLRAARAA